MNNRLRMAGTVFLCFSVSVLFVSSAHAAFETIAPGSVQNPTFGPNEKNVVSLKGDKGDSGSPWVGGAFTGDVTFNENGTFKKWVGIGASVAETGSAFGVSLTAGKGVRIGNWGLDGGSALFVTPATTSQEVAVIRGLANQTADIFRAETSDSVKQLVFKSTGNVGIGTSNPVARLHVVGGEIRSDGAFRAIGGGGGSDGWFRSHPAGNFLEIGTLNVADVSLMTNSSEKVRITSGGGVGIGSAPGSAYKLDVAGKANATEMCIAGDCKPGWPSSFATPNGVTIQGTAGRNYFVDTENAGRVRLGGAWGIPGVYAEDGRDLVLGAASGTVTVGPGSASTQNLTIPNGSIRLKGDATGGRVYFSDAGMDKYIGIKDWWTELGVHTNEGFRVRRNDNAILFQVQGQTGNVGIGTTTNPRSKVDVWGGDLLVTGTDTNGTAYVTSRGGVAYYGNNTYNNGLSVAGNGNVGIGTGDPQERLDVNGVIFSRGTVNVNEGWSPTAQQLSVNSNQIWKSNASGDQTLYLQYSKPSGAVVVGGQQGATNSLYIEGLARVRDRLGIGRDADGAYRLDVNGKTNSSELCLGGDCKSSWSQVASSAQQPIAGAGDGMIDWPNDISGISGSDIVDKQITWDEVKNKPTSFPGSSVDWSAITNKPTNLATTDGTVPKSGGTFTGNVTVNQTQQVGGDLVVGNNIASNCHWLGGGDIAITWGWKESSCPDGEFVAGMKFGTSYTPAALDFWDVKCCKL